MKVENLTDMVEVRWTSRDSGLLDREGWRLCQTFYAKFTCNGMLAMAVC